MFMSLSGDDFYYIFNNISESKDFLINDLINKVWDTGKFNYSALIENYNTLLFEGSYSGKPSDYTLDLSKNMIKEMNDVKGIIPFQKQEYCSFFQNKLSQFDNLEETTPCWCERLARDSIARVTKLYIISDL